MGKPSAKAHAEYYSEPAAQGQQKDYTDSTHTHSHMRLQRGLGLPSACWEAMNAFIHPQHWRCRTPVSGVDLRQATHRQVTTWGECKHQQFRDGLIRGPKHERQQSRGERELSLTSVGLERPPELALVLTGERKWHRCPCQPLKPFAVGSHPPGLDAPLPVMCSISK